jgi:hypothetical protein
LPSGQPPSVIEHQVAARPTHIYSSTLHRRDRAWGRARRRRHATLARVTPIAAAGLWAALAAALLERLV